MFVCQLIVNFTLAARYPFRILSQFVIGKLAFSVVSIAPKKTRKSSVNKNMLPDLNLAPYGLNLSC